MSHPRPEPVEFLIRDWSLVAAGDHVLIDNHWYLVQEIGRWVSESSGPGYEVVLRGASGGRRQMVVPESALMRIRLRSFSDSSALHDLADEPEAGQPAPELPRGEWFRVLGFPCIPGDISLAEESFKRLVMVYHPDRGGSHESMSRLNDAIRQARRHFSLDSDR